MVTPGVWQITEMNSYVYTLTDKGMSGLGIKSEFCFLWNDLIMYVD